MSSASERLGRVLAMPRRQRRRWRDKLRDVWRTLQSWRERARGRRELARLSDRALKDIALSRADALREAEKPFWRE